VNEVAIRTLARAVGLGDVAVWQHHLSDLAGTWHDDLEFDAALAEQDGIDGSLWL
jgi:hypothetical protein